jgi:hypothetical protein
MSKLDLLYFSCIPLFLLLEYPLKHLGNFIKLDT